MPIYYFEIEETTKGWLRIEAPSFEEAEEDVAENGFDASDIVGSEENKGVEIIESLEEDL
jgi:hypothetical protein